MAASACTSAVWATKPPAPPDEGSGATPLNTRYWSGLRSQSMTASAGSSKYSAPVAAMPRPAVPTQSVTSRSSALKHSRMDCASAA